MIINEWLARGWWEFCLLSWIVVFLRMLRFTHWARTWIFGTLPGLLITFCSRTLRITPHRRVYLRACLIMRMPDPNLNPILVNCDCCLLSFESGPIQVAGRYQSGKTSVCCLFKEVNVGYLWIQLWWEYLCWTTCWILTVIWTLILDQLGIGSSPNPQYQVLEYPEHRLFSRGKNQLPALEGRSTIKVRSN